MREYHIDKIYYLGENGETAVTFRVVNDRGEAVDHFDSYTKAERRIVDLLEK